MEKTQKLDIGKIRFNNYEKSIEQYRPFYIIKLTELIDVIVKDFLKSNKGYLIIPKKNLHRNLTAERCRSAIQQKFRFIEVFIDKKNVLIVKTTVDYDDTFTPDVYEIIKNSSNKVVK